MTLDNKPVLKSPPLTRNISADKASPFPIPDVFNGLGNPSGVGGGGRLSQRTGITSGGEAGAAEFTDAQNGACKLTPVCVGLCTLFILLTRGWGPVGFQGWGLGRLGMVR